MSFKGVPALSTIFTEYPRIPLTLSISSQGGGPFNNITAAQTKNFLHQISFFQSQNFCQIQHFFLHFFFRPKIFTKHFLGWWWWAVVNGGGAWWVWWVVLGGIGGDPHLHYESEEGSTL